MKSEQKKYYYIGKKSYCVDDATILCSFSDTLHTVSLYVSKQGAFFTEVYSEIDHRTEVSVISEQDALEIMDSNAAYIVTENYDRIFGKPEQG